MCLKTPPSVFTILSYCQIKYPFVASGDDLSDFNYDGECDTFVIRKGKPIKVYIFDMASF